MRLEEGAVMSAAHTDWVAIAGIAGTFLASLAVNLVSLYVQRRQFDHDRKTRFDEHRFIAYAEFISACTPVIAALGNPSAPYPQEAIDRIQRSFDVIRLIGSPGVFHSLRPAHAGIAELHEEYLTRNDPSAIKALKSRLIWKLGELSNAMRADVGSEPVGRE